MDDVRVLDADLAPQTERGEHVDVVPDRERPEARVRRRHAAGERAAGSRGEQILVAAARQMPDETRDLPLTTAESSLRIDVQDLQTPHL
jgi:hypothetical protein